MLAARVSAGVAARTSARAAMMVPASVAVMVAATPAVVVAASGPAAMVMLILGEGGAAARQGQGEHRRQQLSFHRPFPPNVWPQWAEAQS